MEAKQALAGCSSSGITDKRRREATLQGFSKSFKTGSFPTTRIRSCSFRRRICPGLIGVEEGDIKLRDLVMKPDLVASK